MLLLLALACHPAGDVDTDPIDTDVVDTDVVAVSDDDRTAIEAAAAADIDGSLASGAQIAIYKGGVLVYHAEIGTSMFGGTDPITPDMLFQIGSDTKKLTAVALLQQEQAGNISRDDTVAQAIPGLSIAEDPSWATSATMHDLISHQGGLYDDTPWDPLPEDSGLHDRAFGTFAANEWSMATPGAMWNYSNPNFAIAGLAVETAAGRPYADVIEDDVFAPLGMTRSFARKADLTGTYAIGQGYSGWADDTYDPFGSTDTFQLGVVAMDDVVDNAFTRPAGLVWSTASDMARFGAFLIDGDPAVLDAAHLAAMSTPAVRLYPAFDRQSYAYGLFVYDGISLRDGYHDVRVWTHGGNTLDFTSTTWMVPSSRLSISILSNGYGDDFTDTAAVIMQRLGDLPAPIMAPALPMAERPHAELVGTYVDAYFGDIVVTDLDGELRIQVPGLTALGVPVDPHLTLALTDVYLAKIGGASYDFTFVEDDTGTVRWIRNRIAVGTRGATLRARPRVRSAEEVAIALAEMRQQSAFAPWAR